MDKHRTLIIGLDGATFDLIYPWVQVGHLPTFARLLAQGVHAPLQAWPNMNSASAWSSIVTGYNPGQHGIYILATHAQRENRWRPVTAADRRKDPFWRLLSAAGESVGIINVPVSYPADPVNGFMLAGMDTPGLRSYGFTHPPELLDELQREGIDYVIDVPNPAVLSRGNPQLALRAIQRMLETHSRTILHLMKSRPWNVLMAVFVATDRIQHFFWPDEKVSLEKPDWYPIRSIYQHIDSVIGETLTLVDENTTVLVVSDHGFGPAHFAKIGLNLLFAKLELLHYRQGRDWLQSRALKYLLLYGQKFIPHRLQHPLSQAFPRLLHRARHESLFSGIDWSRTQIFAEEFGNIVRVNLQGREPEGTVSVKDYHPLCERVRDILLNLTDPESGAPLVRAVYRREYIYHGPYLEKAADLVIEWDDEVLQDALCYHGVGRAIIIRAPKRIGASKWLTGTHRSEGIFIANGPHIKQGATLTTANHYDITPTILYLQGHPIPKDMDGRVLTEIFTEGHLNRHPIQYSEPPDVQGKVSTAGLDAEEARKIEERLRGLGYIE